MYSSLSWFDEQTRRKSHQHRVNLDHPHITSVKELGGWIYKIVIFAGVQYCLCADIVGGSEKVQKYADAI